MKYSNIREEELKNKVEQDFFGKFDCTEIIKNIDFAVKVHDSYLLWAEAKQKTTDIFEMLTQLVLTIGKARTFDEILPPPFLGCYDSEKIAFVPYSEIQDVFYQNDFNWKVTPSDSKTREFKQVYAQIKKILEMDAPWQTYIFDFEKDEKELKRFIRDNFIVGKTETAKIRIDKNNFITIYNKWLEAVKPTIQVDDWTLLKNNGIIDGDFYLADLLSAEDKTLREKLSILLKTDLYELNLNIPNINTTLFARMGFSDNQKAYTQFWAKYKRPPLTEYWDYIVDHRHLLVPQDIRERKGSFYTPRIWVELSQKYLADVFGEDWQDEYYVWDCAAGTGNLLVGLTNKYNIWASTLDKADVDVMKDRIQNGANLLEDHVFQFDFLNDDFSKLPKGLQDIINDPKRRKKLIVYINPPYAETNNKYSEDRSGVSETKIGTKYINTLRDAKKELFAQFFARIYSEIPSCVLANFSKLKILQSPNFQNLRNIFQPKLKKMFVVPANTFDNVTGQFPIGFMIWNTSERQVFTKISSDVYDNQGKVQLKKVFYAYASDNYINNWIKKYRDGSTEKIAFLYYTSNDFQQQNTVNISPPNEIYKNHLTKFSITIKNLIETCIYFTVRKVIPATWLNDRDQFLYPNNDWETDEEFQNNCLTYTLFNNNISSKYGVNHWIPFMEKEVNARDKFDSHFMISFINGKIVQNGYSNLFEREEDKMCLKRTFSPEAKKVFDAGRELWKYYHAQPKCNVNASLYDIREYFQGRNDKGKMNNTSEDEKYNELIVNLREKLKILAQKIEPKVYEYGFLKE